MSEDIQTQLEKLHTKVDGINNRLDVQNSKVLKNQNNIDNNAKIINELNQSFTKLSVDNDWIQRFFWIVATASIGGLIASVLNLIM